MTQETFALAVGEVLPFPTEWTPLSAWLRRGLPSGRYYDEIDCATEDRRRAVYDEAIAAGVLEKATIWNIEGGPDELLYEHEYPRKRITRAKFAGCYAVFRLKPQPK